MFAMLPTVMLAGLGFDTNGRFIGRIPSLAGADRCDSARAVRPTTPVGRADGGQAVPAPLQSRQSDGAGPFSRAALQALVRQAVA